MKNNTIITLEQYKKIGTKEMINSYMSGALADEGIDKYILNIFYNLGTRLFVDVGANQGTWIEHIKTYLPELKIIGFEPDVRVYKKCLKDYEFIENIGILNKNGYAKFHYNFDSTQTSNKYHNCASYMKVKVKKLDKYYNVIKDYKFPFIKIDVEGSEPEVLYSAKKILTNLEGVVLFFEYSYKWNYNEKETYELFKYLLQNGFVLFRLNAFGMEAIPNPFYDYLKDYHFSNIVALKGFSFKEEEMIDIDTRFGKVKMYTIIDKLQVVFKKREEGEINENKN